jgi:hypothetical protein
MGLEGSQTERIQKPEERIQKPEFRIQVAESSTGPADAPSAILTPEF